MDVDVSTWTTSTWTKTTYTTATKDIIVDGVTSDSVQGVGWLGGTDHYHFDVTFRQRGDGSEPPVDPDPPVDDAELVQLRAEIVESLALMDQARAEMIEALAMVDAML